MYPDVSTLVPNTTTSIDLQTLFSDIAPVRSAFVVTEQGTGLSKGVGYVAFALKEDAQSAFENISTNGISLVGRKLRVQRAENKVLSIKYWCSLTIDFFGIAKRQGRNIKERFQSST